MEQNAASEDVVLVKARDATTLTPNEETRTLAEVAANNGYVKGEGRGDERERREESTRDHPFRKAIDFDETSVSPLRALLDYVRSVVG